MNLYESINNNLTEGIHLVAYVKLPGSNDVKTLEYNDYNSKKEFMRDLKANEYTVISINDNRDLYLADNTDYTKVSQIVSEMNKYKLWMDDAKKRNPESTMWEKEYNKLKELYGTVMKIEL